MAIIRPAIWVLFGRRKLRLTGYKEVKVLYDLDSIIVPMEKSELYNISGWFEVDNIGGLDYFKLKIERDIVTHLTVGELNV